MPEKYTPYQKESRIKHLEKMEGWRSQAYTINDNSGVTVGFGIDFSQSPYNTSKGLQENGFTREQAEAIMQTGVLGKKVKQLKKEDFDFEKIKEITIPDTDEQKNTIAEPIFKKADKLIGKYKDNVTPEVYNTLTTYAHHIGHLGKRGDMKKGGPFERKNAAANNIFEQLDKEIKENPNQVILNTIVLDHMETSMKVLAPRSPMNSTTILREMESISPSIVADRGLEIYKEKTDDPIRKEELKKLKAKSFNESYDNLGKSSRLHKKNITDEYKEDLIQDQIDKKSVDEGVIGMGDAQLSPDFIRGVQDGTIPLYDEDAKNAIMLLDADDPGSTLSATEISSIKDKLPEGAFSVPGMDKSLIQPVEDTKTLEVGPDPVEEPVEQEEVITLEKEEVTELEAPEVGTEIIKDERTLQDVTPPGERPKKGIGSGLGKVGDWLKNNAGTLAQAGLGLLAGAQGKKSMKEALKDIPVEEGHQLDGAWKAHMSKMRELSQSGLTAEEKYAAQADLSKAYNLGVKNVMRAAGGSRAAFLANAGVLNANRVEGLLKLSAMDAAMQRDNMKNYGKSLEYQQEHGRATGEIDRKMAYNEAKRKSDLHGEIGNALIETAMDKVDYAIGKLGQKGQYDALNSTMEQNNIYQQLKGDNNFMSSVNKILNEKN